MSKKINLTYNQNENDKKIENGFYIVALYLFYIIKFFVKSLFLGYKIIFDFCIASKNLIYKTSKQEKFFLLAKLIISLLGIVNTILATIYYYTLLDKNISLLNQKYLLGLKYFLFIFLLGFVINFKNVLLDKISLAKQKI